MQPHVHLFSNRHTLVVCIAKHAIGPNSSSPWNPLQVTKSRFHKGEHICPIPHHIDLFTTAKLGQIKDRSIPTKVPQNPDQSFPTLQNHMNRENQWSERTFTPKKLKLVLRQGSSQESTTRCRLHDAKLVAWITRIYPTHVQIHMTAKLFGVYHTRAEQNRRNSSSVALLYNLAKPKPKPFVKRKPNQPYFLAKAVKMQTIQSNHIAS